VAREAVVLSLAGREVAVSNPNKPFFGDLGVRKIDLVNYYVSVADGALRGVRARPMLLKRFIDGAFAPSFYQKRAPAKRPPWLRAVTFFFPSGNITRLFGR
jgi:bifunctional non-homologous end joining protein LigD